MSSFCPTQFLFLFGIDFWIFNIYRGYKLVVYLFQCHGAHREDNPVKTFMKLQPRDAREKGCWTAINIGEERQRDAQVFPTSFFTSHFATHTTGDGEHSLFQMLRKYRRLYQNESNKESFRVILQECGDSLILNSRSC